MTGERRTKTIQRSYTVEISATAAANGAIIYDESHEAKELIEETTVVGHATGMIVPIPNLTGWMRYPYPAPTA